MNAVQNTGAIAYTADLARQEAKMAAQAIANLAPSVYKDALYALAEFSVNRTY
jgi:octaprenyl-diphosphate synthase